MGREVQRSALQYHLGRTVERAAQIRKEHGCSQAMRRGGGCSEYIMPAGIRGLSSPGNEAHLTIEHRMPNIKLRKRPFLPG